MIFGLIPCGGKGQRLGLPFPKELLPIKGLTEYKPIISHTVEKMEEAGAEVIYFIHGQEWKQGIVDYYCADKYVHVLQNTHGFAQVLSDFVHACHEPVEDNDCVLFGLPDSVYENNPFIEMINKPDICCGLFTTSDDAKVDRLNISGTAFYIKEVKTEYNQKWFWGVIKFSGDRLKEIVEVMGDKQRLHPNEIGSYLNQFGFTCVKAGAYLDLGTWNSWNEYINS